MLRTTYNATRGVLGGIVVGTGVYYMLRREMETDMQAFGRHLGRMSAQLKAVSMDVYRQPTVAQRFEARQEKALQAQVDDESSVWLSAERWNSFLERMAHVITGNEPVQGVGLRTWVTGVRHLTGFGGDKDAGKADDSTSHLDATPAVADIESAEAPQDPAAIAVPHSDASVIADVAMEAALDLPDGMTHEHAAASSPPQSESS